MGFKKIHFVAAETKEAQKLLRQLVASYGQTPTGDADVVVALGGDGFMLSVLAKSREFVYKFLPVYGINTGHVGFLMNKALTPKEDLRERLHQSISSVCYPLFARGLKKDGSTFQCWAFNDIWMQRDGIQTAHIKVFLNDRFSSAVKGDGVLVAPPLGSTAYYDRCGGIPFSLNSKCLGLSTICSRPETHCVLSKNTRFKFEAVDTEKRPVYLAADNQKISDVVKAEIRQEKEGNVCILSDHKSSIGQRIIRSSFERTRN